MITLEILSKERYRAVQEFYTSVGYFKPIEDEDKVIGVVYQNRIIGAARISTEEGVFVLRGVQVSINFQRQKLGTQLLNRASTLIGENICWCLPYEWLESFYSQIGFKKVAQEQAPLFLQKRMLEIQEHSPVILMVKNSKN